MSKTKAFAAFLALLALVLPFAPMVRAATKPPTAPDPCSFVSKFAELRAIQADSSQDYIQAIRAQLAVRKAILRGAIDCALKDVTLHKAALDNAAPDIKDSKAEDEVAKGLEDSIDYYSAKRSSIDNLGIKGTQDVAREIADWRTYHYNPLISQEDSLLLWNKNQPLFDKASNRFNQLKPIVLSLSLVNQEDIQKKFQDAEVNLKDAVTKNEAAKEAIETGDPDALMAIKSSLEPLSSLYKKFVDLSDAVKKLVP
jgi:hypothetical protein